MKTKVNQITQSINVQTFSPELVADITISFPIERLQGDLTVSGHEQSLQKLFYKIGESVWSEMERARAVEEGKAK